ncbi:bacterio-opsin activator domain-containing protein [Natranaeroarchaeum aerophilus]|uniref:PAS domain-containing protein n=1 Tax=Natranaeroarchaeum aerophilus TaxID=2917711 RepID=A0AAE3FSD6_9EURY|nr:bacterio-opsin activator domain-containing protein [Natranaeroarchaeum aerophilus]MCL9814777.1 PAS domain-containing protein [Natranaeroarchaeum aerophilus]
MSTAQTLLVHPEGGAQRVVATLEDAGCQVEHVEQATAALAKLSARQFDCLVSEHDLPGDDGLSLLSAVRETHPELPVILFTNSEQQEITTRAFENGVSRFLRKNGSASLEQLRIEVNEVTTRGAKPVNREEIEANRPTVEEISRAVQESPIGVTMSDPSLPGNPLVFVNEAWSELTGYDEEQMLGRNPRLLQGPGTDPEVVGELADAIEDEEQVTVEIRNYRSDGTPFWNELTVAPIYDNDGNLAHYVGFQNDVTDRKRTKQLAEQRAEKLAAERTVLQRIIMRVNGLLSDISRILVEENDREVIVQSVCDEVVDSENYVASWIGRTNPTDTQFELSSYSGTVEGIESKIELDSMPAAVGDAIESGTVETCTIGSETDAVLAPESVGARRLTVVPLIYQQKQYGALGVYAEGDNALDSREAQLFESIGQMIASGLNTVETARILTTSSVIELELELYDETFLLSAFAGAIDSEIEYIGLVGEKGSEIYIQVPQIGGEVEELLSLPDVESVRRISETDDGHQFAIGVSSTEPFDTLADYGASVLKIRAEPSRATISLEVPPEYDVRSILELLESEYDRIELRSKHEREGRKESFNECSTDIENRLTNRQMTALKAAHMNGYFEWPREVDGEEVAETMGITRQTFHQHLRAAEQKLVELIIEPN